MRRILGGCAHNNKGDSPAAPATWPRTPVAMAAGGLIFADADVLYDDSLWLRWLHTQLLRASPMGSLEELQRIWDEISHDLYIGHATLAGSLQALFKRRQVPPTMRLELAVAAAKRRTRLHQEARPFAGVVNLLRRLASHGFKLGLLVNSDLDGAQFRNRLIPHGLNTFDVVLTSRDLGVATPRAAAYLNAAAQLKLPLDEVVYVAAHERDLAGAKAAGLRTIACTPDGNGGPCCIATLNELTAHISLCGPMRKTG